MFGKLAADTGDIGLSVVRKISELWRAAKSDSLIDYTRSARVEALTIVDADMLFSEDELSQILQSMQSMFSGYYLQAMAISTNIGSIEVIRHLEKLNPTRNLGDNISDAFARVSASTESYKFRLPTRKNTIALESEVKEVTSTFDKDNIKYINEMNNLSVGKLISVEISDGSRKATIPVSIRLMVNSLPTNHLVDLFSSTVNKLESFKERRIGWKSGRLEFIKDILWCEDLISAHKKNAVHDKTGLYSDIRNRRANNLVSAIVSQNPSVAQASNLLVLSSDTLSKLENKANIKFSNFKDREKVFKESGLMIVAVYNKGWDRVEFYHRGIANTTTMKTKDLKAANKGTGPDVADILKAYQLGNSPVL